VTVTQIETHTQTKTAVVVPTHTVTAASTTTEGANTAAVVVAGAAALQDEGEKSTPWGWVVFGILAAGLAGAGIFWLVRRRRHGTPAA
jgi:hypothetical protein